VTSLIIWFVKQMKILAALFKNTSDKFLVWKVSLLWDLWEVTPQRLLELTFSCLSDQDHDSIQKAEETLTDSSPPTAFPDPAHTVAEEAFNHQSAHTTRGQAKS